MPPPVKAASALPSKRRGIQGRRGCAALCRVRSTGPARAVMDPELALDPELERSDDESVSPPVVRTRDLHGNGLRLVRARSAVVDAEMVRSLGHVLAQRGPRCDRLALPAPPPPASRPPRAGFE